MKTIILCVCAIFTLMIFAPLNAQGVEEMQLVELMAISVQAVQDGMNTIRQLQSMYEQVQMMKQDMEEWDDATIQGLMDELDETAQWYYDMDDAAESLRWDVNGTTYKMWEVVPMLEDYAANVDRLMSGGATQEEIDAGYDMMGVGPSLRRMMQEAKQAILPAIQDAVAAGIAAEDQLRESNENVDKIVNKMINDTSEGGAGKREQTMINLLAAIAKNMNAFKYNQTKIEELLVLLQKELEIGNAEDPITVGPSMEFFNAGPNYEN